MTHLATRMQAVQSPIIPIVGDLIRQHPGTISLGQGIAYYGPPPEAIAQISQFLADPQNHQYKAVEGIAVLQAAIATKLQQDNHLTVDDQRRIVVTAGSNMGFVNAVLAITQPGDEIILQTPYYFNHEMAIRMAGCHPVLVETDEAFQLRPEAIRQAITPRTRAVVTISPNNPSGAVYSEAALREVNALCCDRQIYHISDEAYEYFTYEDTPHFSPGLIEGSAAHTISLFSLSKSYGFAGWRIGYMVIPTELLTNVQKIQDTILICPPVISQYAALGALQAGSAYCREKLQAIAEVRQIALAQLQHLKGICTIPPAQGAFYFLLKVHTELKPMEVVEQLIDQYRVAVLPGTAFGFEQGCTLRVAYGALQQETATAGLERLVQGLQTIVPKK